MNYINLNSFFVSLNRNNIVELGIEQIVIENINYISVYAIHYHNETDKNNILIKSEQNYNIHNFSNISISPLCGLTQLERLKIINIDKSMLFV